MKLIATAALVAATLLAGCASTAEVDQSQAWAKCNSIADRALRSSCISKALADSSAEQRAAQKAEEDKFDAGAKAIEDKAAIEQALGAPADKTGTTIVREPLE